MFRYVVGVIAALIVLTGCQETREISPPPSAADVQRAAAYLAASKTNPVVNNKQWRLGVVLNTRYTDDGWASEWSMTVLLTDGTKVDLRANHTAGFSETRDYFRSHVTPGDEILFDADKDGTVTKSQVRSTGNDVVPITGK